MEKLHNTTVQFLDVLYRNASEGAPDGREAAELFMQIADAEAVGIFFFNKTKKTFSRIELYGECMEPVLAEYYEKWVMRDPRLPFLSNGRLPDFFHDGQYLSHIDKTTHPFFVEWEHAKTPIRHAIGTRIIATDQIDVLFTSGHRFSDEESVNDVMEMYRQLHDHLARALEIHQAYGLPKRLQLTESSMDNLAIGVIMFDQSGEVQHINAKAKEISARDESICITADGVILQDDLLNEKLAQLTADCIQQGIDTDAGTGGWLSCPASDGEPTYSLFVSALPIPEHGGLFSQPKALILIIDNQGSRSARLSSLKSLYGLTQREVEIAFALSSGKNVVEVSDMLCVTQSAIRYHLKNIFSKTNARNQADLVRIVLTLPAATQLPQDARLQ